MCLPVTLLPTMATTFKEGRSSSARGLRLSCVLRANSFNLFRSHCRLEDAGCKQIAPLQEGFHPGQPPLSTDCNTTALLLMAERRTGRTKHQAPRSTKPFHVPCHRTQCVPTLAGGRDNFASRDPERIFRL
jgi:hypothetical protein